MMNLYSLKYSAALAVLSLLFSSCATRSRFAQSDIVPAARGVVKVKQDKNNNYVLDVNVKHLAEPSRLSPPQRVYIVWIETVKNETVNVGHLDPSNSLKASLTTVTPYKPRRLFITAEGQGNLQKPYSSPVLETLVR